jgi:hypothetical protein
MGATTYTDPLRTPQPGLTLPKRNLRPVQEAPLCQQSHRAPTMDAEQAQEGP